MTNSNVSFIQIKVSAIKAFFSISMIIFAKICKSKYYKDSILLFVHPAYNKQKSYNYETFKTFIYSTTIIVLFYNSNRPRL